MYALIGNQIKILGDFSRFHSFPGVNDHLRKKLNVGSVSDMECNDVRWRSLNQILNLGVECLLLVFVHTGIILFELLLPHVGMTNGLGTAKLKEIIDLANARVLR